MDIRKTRIREKVMHRLKQEYSMVGDPHVKTAAPMTGLRDCEDCEQTDEALLKEFPQNWMQGRVSDTHTKLGTTKREYDDDVNFEKDNSGQPDLEEYKRNNVSLDDLSKDEYNTYLHFKKMDSGKKLKFKKSAETSNDKRSDRLLQIIQLTESLNIDEHLLSKLDEWKKIDSKLTETLQLNRNQLTNLIPSSYRTMLNKNDKERWNSTLDDLARTLNHFWKQHGIKMYVKI